MANYPMDGPKISLGRSNLYEALLGKVEAVNEFLANNQVTFTGFAAGFVILEGVQPPHYSFGLEAGCRVESWELNGNVSLALQWNPEGVGTINCFYVIQLPDVITRDGYLSLGKRLKELLQGNNYYWTSGGFQAVGAHVGFLFTGSEVSEGVFDDLNALIRNHSGW
jgi:hypothetical protein